MPGWQWIACGKHPAARDYIRLGNQFPLGSSIYSWVEQGYSQLRHGKSDQQPIKWRFWMNGSAREKLACGILMESADAIGRPYPLLMMGSGNLPGWEAVWEHLPIACEPVWRDAESLAFNEPNTLSKMLTGLDRMASPTEILLDDDTLPPVLPLRTLNGDLTSEFGLFSLETQNWSSVATAAAMRLSLMLKEASPAPPVAVFIGGNETAYMAVMRRPLKFSDFSVLWDLKQR